MTEAVDTWNLLNVMAAILSKWPWKILPFCIFVLATGVLSWPDFLIFLDGNKFDKDVWRAVVLYGYKYI